MDIELMTRIDKYRIRGAFEFQFGFSPLLKDIHINKTSANGAVILFNVKQCNYEYNEGRAVEFKITKNSSVYFQ